MSNIVVEKNKISVEKEVKVIEVPDCTPQLQEAERLKELSIVAEVKAKKTVQVMRDSILEQITTYLYEIFKPCLEYINNNHIAKSEMTVRYGGGRTYFDFCDGRNINCDLLFDYEDDISYIQVSTYDKSWKCKITQYGVIYDKFMYDNHLEMLADNWKTIKKSCEQAIDSFTIDIVSKAKRPLNQAQRTIETLVNFEL